MYRGNRQESNKVNFEIEKSLLELLEEEKTLVEEYNAKIVTKSKREYLGISYDKASSDLQSADVNLRNKRTEITMYLNNKLNIKSNILEKLYEE